MGEAAVRILATRLSENPENSVLVLEVGILGYISPFIKDKNNELSHE